MSDTTNYNLPDEATYDVIVPQTGIISSVNQPFVRVIYGEAIIEYGLITCNDNAIKHTMVKGKVNEEIILSIDCFIQTNLKQLRSIAKLKHFVKFKDGSLCYYCFDDCKLYYAYGEKEKHVKCNGEPFVPRVRYQKFIEQLTAAKQETQFTADEMMDYCTMDESKRWAYKGNAESLYQTYSTFKKLDVAINSSFNSIPKNGTYYYTGNSPIWLVESTEHDFFNLNIEKIFKIIILNRSVVASFSSHLPQPFLYKTDDDLVDSIIEILNLRRILIEIDIQNSRQFVTKNYCKDESTLQKAYARNNVLPGIWNELKKEIEEVFFSSFQVHVYFILYNSFPENKYDLRRIPLDNEGRETQLKQICSSVEDIIVNSIAGIEFFANCNKEVKPDSVIDYITALILISVYYCRTQKTSFESLKTTERLRQSYKEQLLDLIRIIFHYIPPIQEQETLYSLIWEIRHHEFEKEYDYQSTLRKDMIEKYYKEKYSFDTDLDNSKDSPIYGMDH